MTKSEGIEYGILWVILSYIMHEFHYLYTINYMIHGYEKALYSAAIFVYVVWTFWLFVSYVHVFIRRKGGKENEEQETR